MTNVEKIRKQFEEVVREVAELKKDTDVESPVHKSTVGVDRVAEYIRQQPTEAYLDEAKTGECASWEPYSSKSCLPEKDGE
jgi:hypothetical protein